MMTSLPKVRVGVGQSIHRFLPSDSTKSCVLAGVMFDECPGLAADSDGDVVMLSLCNAITTLTGVDILGSVADDLLRKDGITDSQVYVEKALPFLKKQVISHVAISLEIKRPYINSKINDMRKKIADVLKVNLEQVGISFFYGDGLTDVSCGDGIKSTAIITAIES